MRILPAKEEEFRRVIRDARAKDPLITVAGLERVLEDHFKRGFSYNYVSKIADKIAREGLVEIDRAKIEERMAFSRENYRMMREELLKVVYWSPDAAPEGHRQPRAQDRIEAAKTVVMMDLALLQAEITNGLYKKPIEEIAKAFAYEPLPGEVRVAVIAAWQRGGMLPAAAVEQMVPLQIQAATVSPN
jgi:hypothetical protein